MMQTQSRTSQAGPSEKQSIPFTSREEGGSLEPHEQLAREQGRGVRGTHLTPSKTHVSLESPKQNGPSPSARRASGCRSPLHQRPQPLPTLLLICGWWDCRCETRDGGDWVSAGKGPRVSGPRNPHPCCSSAVFPLTLSHVCVSPTQFYG